MLLKLINTCLNETNKQRVGIYYGTAVLRMKLHSNKPFMSWNFNNLDKIRLRIYSDRHHPVVLKIIKIAVIKFISVPVSFNNFRSSISFISFGILADLHL